jgi:molybdenum cofactor biosynthesis enzyme MoaA
MVAISPEFNNLEEMESSPWLATIKKEFANDQWPRECIRCQQTESSNNSSIRMNAIKFDKLQTKKDYLTVGGVLDNICNSACLTCNEQLSTMIGGLKSKTYPIVDNSSKFWSLPLERIVHLDINGGEPSASKNYKHLLANLPPSIQSVRLNTNCSIVLPELVDVANRGVQVTVTVSLYGIGPVYEYVRWPVKWDKVYSNLIKYREMPIKLNLWTTVSALNVDDLPNIVAFAKDHAIDHSYAYLADPVELTVENKGTPISLAYIQKQNELRGI